MTSLDSVLEGRDITLPTKIHLVKAMVFPVVMYGCESWTIKKPVADSFWEVQFYLETVLKSRDITLLTKIHLVKAMVFPVVIY